MSVIAVDGFDTYASVADLVRRWGYQYVPGGISLVQGRFGGQGLQESGMTIYSVMNITPVQTIVAGFAMKVTAWPTAANLPSSFLHLMYLGISNNQNQVGLGISTAYTLEVFRGSNFAEHGGTTLATGTTVLSLNEWYYFEIKLYVHPTAGTVDVYIDGNREISLTGQNTQGQSSGAFVNNVGLVSGNLGTAVFDDFYLDDANAHGPCQVNTLHPAADTAQKDFAPSSGASNYMMIDEAAEDGDTSYVHSSISGASDLYGTSGLADNPDSIFAVQVGIAARKTDTGPRGVIPLLKSGSSGASKAVTTNLSETYSCDALGIWNIDPDTGASWTVAGINAARPGMEVA